MSDELRNLVSKLDPMHPGIPVTKPSQQELEDIMSTRSTTTTGPARKYAAVAAIAVIGVVVAFSALNGNSPSNTTGSTVVAAAPPLELSLGAGDSLASCIVFDVAMLAQMEMAFEGTVTAVADERVALTIDHWFVGGDAASVELSAPAGLEALIGGIDFVQGQQYLITAVDGNVNYCGFSGPSTPEFRAAFEEAFPA